MKVGIEIEVHSDNNSYYTIADKEWLNFETFVNKNWLKVMMSKEYYDSTIEYNFEAHEYSPRYIQQVRDFIQWQIDKYNLKLTTNWPGYVWMHIHIFDLKIRKIWCKKILETTMNFIDKYYDTLPCSSQERLFLSHQLWRNYSYNDWDDYLNYLENEWYNMAYPDYNQNKKKYNPCILSNRSAKGKPRSIEIRILPNEFLMDWNIVYLMDQIKDWDYVWCDIYSRLHNWIDRIWNRTEAIPETVREYIDVNPSYYLNDNVLTWTPMT